MLDTDITNTNLFFQRIIALSSRTIIGGFGSSGTLCWLKCLLIHLHLSYFSICSDAVTISEQLLSAPIVPSSDEDKIWQHSNHTILHYCIFYIPL